MCIRDSAFSEYFRSLTLLVSKYQAKPQPEKVKKTEIDRLLKKALKFYKTCGTESFEALEESSDGYQAYEFIKADVYKRQRMESMHLQRSVYPDISLYHFIIMWKQVVLRMM